MPYVGREALAGVRPLTVLELNQKARDLLEGHFPSVWVTGEVSRVKRAASGHIYFPLKDEVACIDAVVWSTVARTLKVPLSEGLKVTVRGQLTVYPPQGRYQVICHSVEPAGEGALRAAFLKLKARLDAEGLTDPARKRPLPFLPRAVGMVTSESGAAIEDLKKVIWRRFPAMRLVFCPVRVQGDGACQEIIEGLRRMNARDDVDVIVFGRGGGSVEDLWTFNDEALARAIASSRLPTVSAVGHEIDVTIADVRALTPTEAGERVVPVLADLLDGLGTLRDRLAAGARRTGREERRRLDGLGRRPGLNLFPRRLEEERQGLDAIERRLRLAGDALLASARARLDGLGRTLLAKSPAAWIRERRTSIPGLAARLDQAARASLDRARLGLHSAGRTLAALNPLGVLRRGFTVTTVERDGRRTIMRHGDAARPGDRILTAFAQGPDLDSEVKGSVPRVLPEADL